MQVEVWNAEQTGVGSESGRGEGSTGSLSATDSTAGLSYASSWGNGTQSSAGQRACQQCSYCACAFAKAEHGNAVLLKVGDKAATELVVDVGDAPGRGFTLDGKPGQGSPSSRGWGEVGFQAEHCCLSIPSCVPRLPNSACQLLLYSPSRDTLGSDDTVSQLAALHTQEFPVEAL
jgi:hypothetical protein